MCGIVGVLSFNDFNITEPYLIAMRDTMIHRGPDGCGLWISADKKIGLGHRRLSIIDLSVSASQPMSNQDKSLWLTFNGEIYNHVELRKELELLGYNHWQTDHSDTEVILYAFQEWGIDCVQKFRGMFAFALWDDKKQELWLVRDRVGIKPLYYSLHHNRLTFASEIKALLKDSEQPREVNETALYHYLSFLTTPSPDTLFAGIHKLSGGTWMKIKKDGEIKEHRYWDVWDHTQPINSLSEEEIAEKILDELKTSVNVRQIGDVPIGVFLSGGIDSSVNAALFSKNSALPVNTFSIGYQGQYKSYTNELHYAKKMANRVAANYHERLLTVDDLIDFLPEMVKLQDEPIADPVCVPVYYVSKLARDNGTIVCQVGEGADELFWGYPTWKLKLRLQHLANVPGTKWLQHGLLRTLQWWGKTNRLEYEALRRSVNKLPVFWGGAESFTEAQKQSVLSQRLQTKFKDLTSWEVIEPIYKRFKDKAWDQSWLNWMTYLDLNYRLPELLLMRVDKMSMGVSLEGRVPFLDHKFVELAMSIPAKLKTRKGILKYMLKKSVRGVIPDELIDRKKQGFGVPVYEWFFDKLGDFTRNELNDFCDKTDFLDKKQVNQLIARGCGSQVWYLLNFALWWKEYLC